MHPARLRVLRRAAIYGALATLLTLTAIALTQCTMVGDNLTGVSLSSVGPGQCISQCAQQFNDAVKAEFERYARDVFACGRNKDCLKAAKAVHDANMDKIKDDFRKCREECHHQGGGHSR
jgi:hypothetical protein